MRGKSLVSLLLLLYLVSLSVYSLGVTLSPEVLPVTISSEISSNGSINTVPAVRTKEPLTDRTSTSSIFFTGDIMLARHVEYLRGLNGGEYSYRQLHFLKTDQAYVVGNFEAAIPAAHTKTPDFTFRFSVDSEHVPNIRKAGFTHMSLANNHAYDYGANAFWNTQENLSHNHISAFGHPEMLSSSSLTYLTIDNKHIAVMGINTVDDAPEPAAVGELISQYASTSDMVVAYIHWGTEYERLPSTWQRSYARGLVAKGVDIIIGHHPHVVQGIEKIGDSMVFYSLGNFIFDQYFSEDVQNGLVLKMTTADEGVKISLIPVTSIGSRAQPRPVSEEERKLFLADLALYSDENLGSEILTGQLSVPFSLATSTEMSIMEL